MNELKDLAELVSQYDWREAISVGVGTATGLVHAVYDKTKGNRRKSNSGFGGGVAAFSAAFNPYDDGLGRGLGNGIAGGLAYHLVYTGTYKLLDRISRDSAKEMQE
jgi:hypothetical protein